MRRWLGEQMARPWVYRTTCGVLFVVIMYALRVALIALKGTHDLPLIAEVCIPGIIGCNLLAVWLTRRGY